MAELAAGAEAPAFTLTAGNGRTYSLSELRGRTIVLFFYPKDDTDVCTKEACAFRDAHAAIKRTGAMVIGISPDPKGSHRKFSQKYDLNFPLLSDEGKEVLMAYGVWQEKSMYGRKYMGVVRTTYIIDGNGRIAHCFPKVKVKGHIAAILKALTA